MEEFNKSKKRFIINSSIMLFLLFVLFGIAAYCLIMGIKYSNDGQLMVVTFLFSFLGGIFAAAFGAFFMFFSGIGAILKFVAIMMANKKKKPSIVLSWINIVLLAIPGTILLPILISTKNIMCILIGIIILAVWILDIISTVKFGKALKQISEANKVDNVSAKEG